MSLHETTDTTEGEDYTPEQLLRMDEEEARMWLSEEDQERRAKLRELYEGAEKQREEWQEQEQTTVETLIEADMGELTTELDLYGNEVEVLLNLDRDQRQLIERIQTKYEGADDIQELDEAEIRRLESMLAEFFEVVIHSFNGEKLDDLGKTQAVELTEAVVEEWGTRASIYAMIEIIETINEQDEQTMERVQKFRGETGG
jgi:hypothetical protein